MNIINNYVSTLPTIQHYEGRILNKKEEIRLKDYYNKYRQFKEDNKEIIDDVILLKYLLTFLYF